MKQRLFILFLVFLFMPISANALSFSSSYNSLSGTTNYTFDDGTSAYSYKEGLTGNTIFNLSDGSYGSAYTDMTGTTHYNFSQSNFNNKKFLVVSGRCSINYGNFICLQESQYQEIYSSILSGMPSCNTSGSESGGAIYLPGNAEYCDLTPEGKEQYILNSSVGQRLKMCRDSLNLYKQIQASYDKCVQVEDQKYIDSIRLKLSYLTGQAQQAQRNQQNVSEVSTCPINSVLVAEGCRCNRGYVWHKSSGNSCVKCESAVANSYYEDSISKCACNSGYDYDLASDSCKLVSSNVNKEIRQGSAIIKPIPSNTAVAPQKNPVKEYVGSGSTNEAPAGSFIEENSVNKVTSTNNSHENIAIKKLKFLGQAIKSLFMKFKFW